MQQISTNVYKVDNSDDLNDAYWQWVDSLHNGEVPSHPINLTRISGPATVEFKRARTGRYTTQDSAIVH